jgi:cell division protein FtsW
VKLLESAQMGSGSSRPVPQPRWSDAEASSGQVRVVKPLPSLPTMKPMRPLPPLSAITVRQGRRLPGSPLPDLDDLADRPSLPPPPDSAEQHQKRHAADVAVHSPLSQRLRAASRPGAPDYWLILAVMALLVIGLVMVDSASQFATPGDPSYWFRHQLVWALLGGGALLVALSIDYHLWRRMALPAMLLGLALLVAVLVVGVSVSGAQRWIVLGDFSFQPSELVKLLLVIYCAHWLVRRRATLQSVSGGLVPFTVLICSVLLLIILQNDMGTSVIVALTGLAMFYAAGGRVRHILAIVVSGSLAYLVIIMATNFRRARFDAFLHPLPPACGGPASYQLCQGLISLGSGGITGRGLGDSIQKAGYLPNPFTDGIFAVIGEELGLVGSAAIIFLFVVVAYRGLLIAQRAPDTFGSLLACGITCWIIAQAAVNIGSVANLIPFTGVPLPFVSFGGSSLISLLAAVGILLNISRHTHRTFS